MAKLSFTKLGLKKNDEIKTIVWNKQTIEVKQYLPINNKLELISNVIMLSADENNFSNPVKLDIFLSLEILEAYTNISFTEKQKEDVCKLYDLFKGSGLLDMIITAIPENEYKQLQDSLMICVDAIYTYRHSVLGILETISQDYENLNLDASAIQKALADPENMSLLKDVLTKLG